MTTATIVAGRHRVHGPRIRRAHPTARRVWRFASGVLLLLLAAGAVTGMVTVIHERIGFSPVLSPSMEPAFRPGDLLITKPEPATAIKVGQVVVLPLPNAPGQRYVHRIVGVTVQHGQAVVQTKGDANPAPEPFHLRVTSHLVPQVVATVPRLGRLALLMQHSLLRLSLILLTAGFGVLALKRLIQAAITKPDD
ncbi:MAG TPA: signal peptidase I [Mycobacteriales bacterium]|nr:signal peptidase I [Mycobacteriales bacterium]